MKKTARVFLVAIFLFACSKSNDGGPSKETGKTTYTIQMKIGNQNYHTSNYSVQSGSVDNYQFDGLNIFGHRAACTAYAFQVDVSDTTNGRLGGLLSFLIPSVSNFSNFKSWFLQIYLKDTIYSGYVLVSSNITSNDGRNLVGGDSTINGSFDLNGLVNNGISIDSVAFSANMNFTNMPY